MEDKKTSNIYGQVYKFAKEPLTSLEQVYPGDHVAYERVKLYWHHVIVEDIDNEGQQVSIIHYYNDIKGFFETTTNQGSIAKVMRGTIKFWSKRFYRIVYNEDLLHPPEKVLELAMERLGEAQYSPLNHNCEHFCTECKIGQKLSIQVESLIDTILVTVLPPLSRVLLEQLLRKAVQESIKNLSKEITKTLGKDIFSKLSQSVFQIALTNCGGLIGSHTAWVFLQQSTVSVVKGIMADEVQKLLRTGTKEVIKAATRNISRKGIPENSSPGKVKCRITKSGVLAGVAVELAFAGKDIRDASMMRQTGRLTKTEYEELVIKRVVGASVSAPMSVAGSIVGQYVIPVPVLGNVVGGITGSAAGRVVGAVLSSSVIKTRHHVENIVGGISGTAAGKAVGSSVKKTKHHVGKIMGYFSWKR